MRRFFSALMCVSLCLHLFSCSNTPQKNETNGAYKDIYPPAFSTFYFDSANLEELFKDSTYVVTYQARLTYNESVGNEWVHGLKHNDEVINNNRYITQPSMYNLTLTAFATELDSYNDHGYTYVTFNSLKVGAKETKEVTVTVRENRGRYAGNIAQWTFTITVERLS